MICETCHEREATIFLTQIVDQKMRKVDLCEKCARALGVNQASGYSLTNLLLKSEPQGEVPITQKMVCRHCGFSESELRKTGRFGCPRCYEVFSKIVQEIVNDAQRATKHAGKIPRKMKQQIQTDAQRHNLEQALVDAIHAENYEAAAQLRDQLKEIIAKNGF